MKTVFIKQEILDHKIGSLVDEAIERISFINDNSFTLNQLLDAEELPFNARMTIPFYACELSDQQKDVIISAIQAITGDSTTGTWKEKMIAQFSLTETSQVRSQILQYLKTLQ